MASTTSSISLHGAAEAEDVKAGSTSAILLTLSERVLQDVRKASQEKERLHFVSGATPKLRIGSRLIDLTLSADDFRNELFASTSPADFSFTSIVSHRAEVKVGSSKASDDTAGPDAALAALQNSLASLKQEKEAKQANITGTLIPAPKSRHDAARKERQLNKMTRPGLNGLSRPSTPAGGASSTHLAAAPTSAPTNDEDLKLRAMRTPLIHLLASEPLRSEQIVKKTHIPREDLDNILHRIGKPGEAGKWLLSDKAYKDLDVWKFEYPSQEKRQAAIDNAVRAYDRMRLDKDNQLWQSLLPKEERGKGKILSRLQLGAGQMNRGLTPNYQPSPMPHMAGTNDSRAASAVNTPKLGPSTPRPGSSKSDVTKRLFSKDPQKARAAEDAKEKKRKEREAAASDREGGTPAKKQATKKTNVKSNVKSEEFVHSSDEDIDEEPIKRKRTEQNQSSPEKEKPNANAEPPPKAAKAPTKAKSQAVVSASSDSSDTALKEKAAAKAPARAPTKPKSAARTTESPAVKPARPTTAGKSTPKPTTAGKSTPKTTISEKTTSQMLTLSAPNSQQKSQRSPSNPGNRPSVPSPLGAARPRVASDVSDRGAVGVQKVRQGAETPKGLGITENSKLKQTMAEIFAPSKQNGKPTTSEPQQEPTTNGSATPKALVNGVSHKTDARSKRKAEELPVREGEPTIKHRKTESTSSQTHKSQAESSMATNGIKHNSPNGALQGGNGSNAGDIVLENITYDQGCDVGKKFFIYYANYEKEYDAQLATQTRGETVDPEDRQKLLKMHEVLARMKKEMNVASGRQFAEGD